MTRVDAGAGAVPPRIAEIARQLRDGFRATHYRRTTQKSDNGWTLAVVLHELADDDGRRVRIVEKRLRNRWPLARSSPEVFFYETLRPLWRAARRVSPALLGLDRGVLSSTLYLSFVGGRTIDFARDFDAALALVTGLHGRSRRLLRRPEIAARPFLRALFHGRDLAARLTPAPYRRHLRDLRRQPVSAALDASEWKALEANLGRLERICAGLPHAVCHLDLASHNLRVGRRGAKLIDWGEVRAAPLGFDYGSLLAASLRRLHGSELGAAHARFWSALDAGVLAFPDARPALVLSAVFLYAVKGMKFLARPQMQARIAARRDLQERVAYFFDSIRPLTLPDAELSADRLAEAMRAAAGRLAGDAPVS